MRDQALLDAVMQQRNDAQNQHANARADLAVAVAMVTELREEITQKSAEIARLNVEIGALTARAVEAYTPKE